MLYEIFQIGNGMNLLWNRCMLSLFLYLILMKEVICCLFSLPGKLLMRKPKQIKKENKEGESSFSLSHKILFQKVDWNFYKWFTCSQKVKYVWHFLQPHKNEGTRVQTYVQLKASHSFRFSWEVQWASQNREI